MMSASERVKALYDKAERLGMDHPTTLMIEDMIHDVEFDSLWNPMLVAVNHEQDIELLKAIWYKLGQK